MPESRHRIARYAAGVLLALGLIVCIGWQFRIPVLKGQSFGTFVAPNTALLFILVSVSSLLQLTASRTCQRVGQAIGIFIAVFAAMTTAEYLFHVDLRIERIFFSHRLSEWRVATPPGRMAFPTAVAFAFAGIGITTVRLRQAGSTSDWCATVVAAISYLGLIGYGFSLAKLYGGVMALHTAVLLAVVALIVFTARTGPGVADIMASREAGGVVFRRVIPAIVVLMPVLGFLRTWAQRVSSVSFEMGTALFVVVAVFIFTAITAHTAGVLNVLDLKRKQAEQALIRGEKLAAAGRLSATIAHEINNPLAAVMNLLYLASTGNSAETTAEYIRAAEKQLHRASEITKRTLGFYREDTHALKVSLSALAEEVLDIFQATLIKKHVEVATEFACSGVICARPGEIRQIMANLIGNAIDAVQLSEEPQITVSVREGSGLVEFAVKDNGCGIRTEHLQRIFEPFFTTKKNVGNGLGLYVSTELAHKNGGRLQVESFTEPSASGTTFALTLPLALTTSDTDSRAKQSNPLAVGASAAASRLKPDVHEHPAQPAPPRQSGT